MTRDEPPEPKGIRPLQSLLFAVVAGISVGNLYWAQPLLAIIAESFGISAGSAGMLITVTQMGYAAGIVLIVPAGDMVDRRKLIPAVMLFSVLSLTGCFLAKDLPGLYSALGLLGMTTVTGQILTPLASSLARPDQRGRVVGTIVSGMLTGILLSRSLSGLFADMLGWRSIYAMVAAATAVLTVLMIRSLPADGKRPQQSYRKLLASIPGVLKRYRAARITLMLGASAFSVFTAFWTGLTFLLSAPPYSYSMTRIGLVGLVGLAGALTARRAGWLHDHGYSALGAGAGLLLAFGSLLLAAFGMKSIRCVLAAVLFLDIAVQVVNVLNQTRLFSIAPDARSRLNTAFVFCNFIAGAIGSALAGFLWDLAGWPAIMCYAGLVCLFALAVWFVNRKELTVERQSTTPEQAPGYVGCARNFHCMQKYPPNR